MTIIMQFLVPCFVILGYSSTVLAATVQLNEVVHNINNIMTTYNQDLDKVVPFKELRASLTVLDSLAQNYHGSGSRDIADASKLGYAAAEEYYKAVDTVFRWCLKAEMYCNCAVVKHSNGTVLSHDDPLFVLTALLRTGLTEVSEAIDILERVRDMLTKMQAHLRPVPSALTTKLNDLRWDYNRQRQERIRDVNEENRRREEEAALKVSSTLVLGLFGGPIGAALGLAHGLSESDFPRAVLNQEVEASKAQQLKITEVFMESLIKAVDKVIKTIRTVKEEIHREITNVKALQGAVDGHLMLMIEYENFPDSELQTLKETVHEFINRHGDGSHQFRERRDLVAKNGRTWEEISQTVEEYMDATAVQREVEYWALGQK